jgi:transcriptional regulator with PAS, ATPase and Fis domain
MEGKHMSQSHAITTDIIKQWNSAFLFKILDNIQAVVMVIDAEATIVYVNEAYTTILGVPAQDVIGRNLAQIEPDARAIKILKSGIASHNQKDHLASLGIDVMGGGFPIYEGDQIMGCVAIFYDISEVTAMTRELQLAKGVSKYLQEQLNEKEQLPLSFQEYVGWDGCLKETLQLAAKVAKTDSTVLIRGESGVGKGVLARAIHNSSKRKERPLIIVNCAAIPEPLLESELFGYDEGAFSGAKKGGKPGKFELANGGTIFLDEIGDMSTGMQAKLLRVLQEREVDRVGGTRPVKVDIRVIAATNRDLERMIKEGSFRSDLYYRLSIVPLRLPPLRERKADIVPFAQYFLAKSPAVADSDLTLSPAVIRVLQSYSWPGNIRELQNILEYASIVHTGTRIEVWHLPEYLRPNENETSPASDKPYDLRDTVNTVERDLLMSALASSNNNRSAAIKQLGISRSAFYDKLRRYNIGGKQIKE